MKLYCYDEYHTCIRSYNDSFSHKLKSRVYNECMECRCIGIKHNYHISTTISYDYSFNGRWITAHVNLNKDEIKFMYYQMTEWKIKKKLRIKLGLFPMVEFKGR